MGWQSFQVQPRVIPSSVLYAASAAKNKPCHQPPSENSKICFKIAEYLEGKSACTVFDISEGIGEKENIVKSHLQLMEDFTHVLSIRKRQTYYQLTGNGKKRYLPESNKH